jgi:hypothetical protein
MEKFEYDKKILIVEDDLDYADSLNHSGKKFHLSPKFPEKLS